MYFSSERPVILGDMKSVCFACFKSLKAFGTKSRIYSGHDSISVRYGMKLVITAFFLKCILTAHTSVAS